MSREVHVRFWESAEVRFLRATHLPLYRQERIFLRQGIHLSRKTMAGWLGQLADKLIPLWEGLAALILESGVVHHDDTPVKMLEPGKGKTKETRLWVAMSGSGPPLVHFTFSTDRSQKTPIDFFQGYSGAVMCDEYAGYANVDHDRMLSCWAHARRYVEKAQKIEPRFASEALLKIAKLYRIEKRIKPFTKQERQHIRETESRNQVDTIFTFLGSQTFTPQSPMTKAINYITNHREALLEFTKDESLPIDNNPVERALRRVAIGRKNWMFLGSETGGRTAAVLMSLLSTCWANHVNAWTYLKDVFDRLPTQPDDQLEELLPHIWVEKNPQDRLPNHAEFH
jgi:transposase